MKTPRKTFSYVLMSCTVLLWLLLLTRNRQLSVLFEFPFKMFAMDLEKPGRYFVYPENRERFDWKSILRPCKNNMSWIYRQRDHSEAEWRTNALKSRIIEYGINPAGFYTKFILESKTKNGKRKTVGGDFWRAYLTGTGYQHGYVYDLNNGSYEIWFAITEIGNYTLNLLLEFSMCDGLKDPPEDWFQRGNIHGEFQEDGILGYLDDYLLERMTPFQFEVKQSVENITSLRLKRTVNCIGDRVKETRTFCSPSDFKRNCEFVWDGYGTWKQNGHSFSWKPNFEVLNSTDFETKTKLDTLWFLGDSIIYRLWNSSLTRVLCRKAFKSCKKTYTWVYEVGKNVCKRGPRNFGLKFNQSRFLLPLIAIFAKPEMKSNRSVLVINFGLHIVMTLRFSEYKSLMDAFIERLGFYREQENRSVVPQILWKTTTLSHKENTKHRYLTRARFLTNHRISLFNAYTNAKLCSAGITILDIFPISASFPKGSKDHVHYEYFVFEPAEDILAEFVWKKYNV